MFTDTSCPCFTILLEPFPRGGGDLRFWANCNDANQKQVKTMYLWCVPNAQLFRINSRLGNNEFPAQYSGLPKTFQLI